MSSITDDSIITYMPVNPATTTRKIVAMTHEMVEAVAAYRFSNCIETEAEAIRRLIDVGLKATAPDKPPITSTLAKDHLPKARSAS